MNYKEKLKSRLYLGIIYIVIGVIIMTGTSIWPSENEFISAFGFVMLVLGVARIRNYYIITKNDETIRKQQIIETDERNISIINKARSATFIIYILLLAISVIVLSFLNMREVAKWIAYAEFLLVLIYWICYWIYQKKS